MAVKVLSQGFQGEEKSSSWRVKRSSLRAKRGSPSQRNAKIDGRAALAMTDQLEDVPN
jgi:hypothetical protein